MAQYDRVAAAAGRPSALRASCAANINALLAELGAATEGDVFAPLVRMMLPLICGERCAGGAAVRCRMCRRRCKHTAMWEQDTSDRLGELSRISAALVRA